MILYNEEEDEYFPCHRNCQSCYIQGNDIDNKCLSCRRDLYFDDEITTNCVDDDPDCDEGCAKCYKNYIDSNYDMISPDKTCKRCSPKKKYYPLEQYSISQSYVSCYHYKNSPKNFYFNSKTKTHNLCYRTCETCYQDGHYDNHSCSTCHSDFVFVKEKPFNCYPKCNYFYYFNYLDQYKCTEDYECPQEYPYLISNKSKCIDNCYKDKEYRLTFQRICLKTCPKGSKANTYVLNGETTKKCINSNTSLVDDTECKLNSNPEKTVNSDITQAQLNSYAKKFKTSFSSQPYVETYSFKIKNKEKKYLIILYKLERCLKEKMSGFSDTNLNECIEKIITKNKINDTLIVEIVYIIQTEPKFDYYLYHPTSAKKLDTLICSEKVITIIVKSNVFDNKEVNEE